MESETQEFRLKNGRCVGYSEYGAPGGTPLLYFHGWPSSRLEARCLRSVAEKLGIHVFAPERPGFGCSDFQPQRSMSDWTADIQEFADALRLESFTVLGVSGGGPYAAACAALIPHRLKRVLMVCSVGPTDAPGALDGMVALNRWLLTFARNFPWLAQKTATLCLTAFWGHGRQVIPRQVEERLPPADRTVLQDQDLRATLTAASQEALRPGPEGAAWDGFLLGQPWSFELGAIRVPVRLWHGEKDNIVPVAMGRYLAQTIPGCEATFYPDDGHFSLPYGRVQEILQAAI